MPRARSVIELLLPGERPADLDVGLDAGGRQLAGGLLLVAAVGDEGQRVGLHEQQAAEPVNPVR